MNPLIVKLLLCLILGSIIGFERLKVRHTIGPRTMVLIVTGSCIFTYLGTLMFIATSIGDLSRVPAGIVQGLGFIGAGIIFRKDEQIQGLTTAAEVWVAGGLGIMLGLGLNWEAILLTGYLFAVMTGLRWLEAKLRLK